MTKPTILIVDDDAILREDLRVTLEGEGYATLEAGDGKDALQKLESETVDMMLLDLYLPRMSGLEVLERSITLHPHLPVVMISGQGSIADAVEATKKGAFDFLEKPLGLDKTLITVRNALQQKMLRMQRDQLLRENQTRYRMVGSHPKMQKVFELIDRAARVDSKVLITGEPGTGKELVARAIHANSARAGNPFIPVNCSAIPETLIESELFGHVRGAFTGAVAERIGRFQRANHGTLFLDEIGDMSLMMQAKVLRVLEDGLVEPVGSHKPVPVDVRLIAATNRDLAAAVAEGTFREDLFYRLNVIHIELPPLRERKEDIRPLAEALLEQVCTDQGLPQKTLSENVWPILYEYEWPGNVRQLRNVIERAAVLSPDVIIDAPIIQESLNINENTGLFGDSFLPLREARAQFERAYILKILRASNFKIADAARILGIERSHLYKKLRQYNISVEEEASAPRSQ